MEKKYINYGLYALIIILIALSVYFLYDITTEELDLSYYEYSNGDTVFEVTIVSDDETQIPVFVDDDGPPYLLHFQYDPLSVEDISIDRDIYNKIYDVEQIYVTIDPNAGYTSLITIAAFEIEKFFDVPYLPYNIPVNSAFISKYGETVVKTCEDATLDTAVIWLYVGDKTQVYSNGYCIIVEGTSEAEVVRATDRLMYYMFGIVR
ncbi:MAG: hypothetical protein ABIF40_05355 [archaeon]